MILLSQIRFPASLIHGNQTHTVRPHPAEPIREAQEAKPNGQAGIQATVEPMGRLRAGQRFSLPSPATKLVLHMGSK